MIGRALGMVVTLCAMVARAQASCPITLEGDGAVVDDVRAELRAFGDGQPPCVALWVRCRQNGTQLEIDLHDELGRSSLHLFASAGGAAAFLISWSRRPLPAHGPDAPPGLVEPGSPPSPTAAPSQDRGWHAETSVAYAFATGLHTPWGTATTLVMKHAGPWRYGGGGLVIAGSGGKTISVGIEAAVGVQTALLPQVTVAGELFAGDVVVARDAGFEGEAHYGAAGLRTGFRAGLTWQFSDAFGLGLEWGYDVVQSEVDPSNASGVTRFRGLALPSHVALALRWLP